MNLIKTQVLIHSKNPHKPSQISNTTQIQFFFIFFILLLPVLQIKVFHQSFHTRSLSNGKTLLS